MRPLKPRINYANDAQYVIRVVKAIEEDHRLTIETRKKITATANRLTVLLLIDAPREIGMNERKMRRK